MKIPASEVRYGDVVRLPGIGQVTVTTVRQEGGTTVLCTSAGEDVCETQHRIPSSSTFEVQRPGSLFGDAPKQARQPASAAEEIFEETRWAHGGKTWPSLHRHLNARTYGFSDENRKARAAAFKHEIAIANALRRALALPKRPTVAQVDRLAVAMADVRPQQDWVRVGILEPGGRWWILQDADTRREKTGQWVKSTGPFTLGLGRENTRSVLREATKGGERPFHIVLLPMMESKSTGGSGSGTLSHPLGRVEYEAPKELITKAGKTRARGASSKRAIREALTRRGWSYKRSGRYDYVTDPDDVLRLQFRDRSVRLQGRDFDTPAPGSPFRGTGSGKWSDGTNIGSPDQIAADLDSELAGLDRALERQAKQKREWVSFRATEAGRKQQTSSWEDDTNPDVTVRYSFADGIIVCGQTRQHADKLKSLYGFQRLRFSGRMLRQRGDDCAWYVPKTRDTIQEYGRIENLAKTLRDKGLRVALDYEKPDEQSAEEREERREAKLERIAERRQDQAAKASGELRSAQRAARAAVERLPEGGEPIKVGHHSERRHRRDIGRAQRTMSKAVAAQRDAEAAHSRAAGATYRAEAHGTLPDLYARYGTTMRNLAQARRPSAGDGPAARRRREELAEDAELLRKKIEAAGGRILGPSDFSVGQQVRYRGDLATIKRVNKKTLTLDPDPKTVRADFRVLDIWKPTYLELLGAVKFVTDAPAPKRAKAKAPSKGDRSKVASKLRKVAQTLDKRADEALADPSDARTPRQVRMAASKFNRAQADKARAVTLRNIADRLESGADVDPGLARVATAKDVEAIEDALIRARNRRAARERTYRPIKEPPSSVDVPYAEVDTVTAHASRLRELAKIQKRKADARKVEKVADRIMRNREGYGALSDDEIVTVSAALKPSAMKAKPPTYQFASLKEQVLEHERLAKLGLNSTSALQRTLKAYLACCRGKKSAPTMERTIASRERELMLQKIPGYFPTPDDLAERMVKAAQIGAGNKVLEPSAGSGRIAAAIKRAEPKAELSVIEFNAQLRDLLKEQGFNVVGGDFLEHKRGQDGVYDAIVMNPPFEKRQDASHLRRALRLVKPGGRVVSIVSGSFPSRTDKLTADLRAEIEREGGTITMLPAGSFQAAGTNVQTALVEYQRPAAMAETALPVGEPAKPARKEAPVAKPSREDKILNYEEVTAAWNEFRKAAPTIKARTKVPLKAIGNFCLQATDADTETSVTLCPALQPKPIGDCPAMSHLRGKKILAVCQPGRDPVYFGRGQQARAAAAREVQARFDEARRKKSAVKGAKARRPAENEPVPSAVDFVAQANLLTELLPLGIYIDAGGSPYMAEVAQPQGTYDYQKSGTVYTPQVRLENPYGSTNAERKVTVGLSTLISKLADGSARAWTDTDIPFQALTWLSKLQVEGVTTKDARSATVGKRLYWLENAAGERRGPLASDGSKPDKALLAAFREKFGGRSEVPPPELPKGWTLDDTIVLGFQRDKKVYTYGAYHVPTRAYKTAIGGGPWKDGGLKMGGIWPDYHRADWREGAYFGPALENTLDKLVGKAAARRPRVWGPWHGVAIPGLYKRDAVLFEPATGAAFPLEDLQKALVVKVRKTTGPENKTASKALRWVQRELERAKKAAAKQAKAAKKSRKKAVSDAKSVAKEVKADAKAGYYFVAREEGTGKWRKLTDAQGRKLASMPPASAPPKIGKRVYEVARILPDEYKPDEAARGLGLVVWAWNIGAANPAKIKSQLVGYEGDGRGDRAHRAIGSAYLRDYTPPKAPKTPKQVQVPAKAAKPTAQLDASLRKFRSLQPNIDGIKHRGLLSQLQDAGWIFLRSVPGSMGGQAWAMTEDGAARWEKIKGKASANGKRTGKKKAGKLTAKQREAKIRELFKVGKVETDLPGGAWEWGLVWKGPNVPDADGFTPSAPGPEGKEIAKVQLEYLARPTKANARKVARALIDKYDSTSPARSLASVISSEVGSFAAGRANQGMPAELHTKHAGLTREEIEKMVGVTTRDKMEAKAIKTRQALQSKLPEPGQRATIEVWRNMLNWPQRPGKPEKLTVELLAPHKLPEKYRKDRAPSLRYLYAKVEGAQDDYLQIGPVERMFRDPMTVSRVLTRDSGERTFTTYGWLLDYEAKASKAKRKGSKKAAAGGPKKVKPARAPAKGTVKKAEATTKPAKPKAPRKRKRKGDAKARDWFFVRDQDGKVISRHSKLEPAVMAAKRAAIDESMAGAASPAATVWEGSQAGKAEPTFGKRRARVTAPSLAKVDTKARVKGDRYHAGVLGMCGVVMGKAAAKARKAKKAAKRGKKDAASARKNTRALIRELAGG